MGDELGRADTAGDDSSDSSDSDEEPAHGARAGAGGSGGERAARAAARKARAAAREAAAAESRRQAVRDVLSRAAPTPPSNRPRGQAVGRAQLRGAAGVQS